MSVPQGYCEDRSPKKVTCNEKGVLKEKRRSDGAWVGVIQNRGDRVVEASI